MRYLYYSAIPLAGTSRLLMLPQGDGWTLPCNQTEEFHVWQEVHREHRLLRETMGLDVHTLRLIWLDYSPEKGRVLYLYARTPPSPQWRPPTGAAWIETADLSTLVLDEPDMRPGIEAWYNWHTTLTAEKPLPWSRPQWYQGATAWIEAQLAEEGLSQTGPHLQLTSRPRGTVFKTATDQGDVYFKAVSRIFAHEPELSARLGQWYGDLVPPLMAADKNNLWFIGKGIAGDRLDDLADIALWQLALRRYAELQVKLAGRVDALRTLGCPEAPLLAYTEKTRRIIEAETWGVSLAEFTPLLDRLSALEGSCQDLYRSPLPLSLDHGDLSPSQILFAGQKPFILDWSDSAIGHPFFSLFPFFEALEYLRDNGPPPVKAMLEDFDAVWEKCTEAYLEAWLDFAPLPRLQEYLLIAQKLAPLHMALKFARFLEHGIDTQWDMTGSVPMYLRKLL